jgi:hypothetical protein
MFSHTQLICAEAHIPVQRKFGIDRSAAVIGTSVNATKFPILVTTFWTWASIIGLSMTPNLVMGPSAAVGVGIEAHYSPLFQPKRGQR